MSGHHKNKVLLSFALCVSLLCLLQVACKSDNTASNTDDAQELSIDPSKFTLDVADRSTTNNNIVAVKIIPGSNDISLEEFFVTASIVENKGTVKGAVKKTQGKGLDYTVDLNGCCVATLSHTILKARKNSQGNTITFRAQVTPDASIKTGNTYTLIVQVERKGRYPHIATQSTELTAKRDGVDTEEKAEQENTSDTRTQATVTAPDAVADNAIQPISQPAPNESVSIPTEGESPQLVSETALPAIPNNEAQQPTSPASAFQESSSYSSLTASAQQPASKPFTVILQDITQRNNARHFVLVIIKPSSSDIRLEELAITAHVENNLGVVKGSSGRNSNGFIYDKVLDNCNLEALLLAHTRSNRSGKDDASLEQGGELVLKLGVKPDVTVRPGSQCTLTVAIAYTGSHPHTETQSTTLTVTPKTSPLKKKKR